MIEDIIILNFDGYIEACAAQVGKGGMKFTNLKTDPNQSEKYLKIAVGMKIRDIKFIYLEKCE